MRCLAAALVAGSSESRKYKGRAVRTSATARIVSVALRDSTARERLPLHPGYRLNLAGELVE